MRMAHILDEHENVALHDDDDEAPPAPAPAPAPLKAQLPATIATALGIDKRPPVALPKRFAPQYPTPQPVGNVVDDAFYGYDAAPVALSGSFFKKKPAAKLPKSSVKMTTLEKAKAFSDKAVVQAGKGVTQVGKGVKQVGKGVKQVGKGVAQVRKGVSDKLSGMDHFDFKLYNTDFTALLGVAKKDSDGKTNDKNNYQTFGGDANLESARLIAGEQEQSMMRTLTQVRNDRGEEPVVITTSIKGRSASCLGFAQVKENPLSEKRYGDRVSPVEGSKKGDATLVSFTSYTNNGTDEKRNPNTGMKPISGLVVEALKISQITAKDDKVLINMIEVPGIASLSKETITTNDVIFRYRLCVHGIHVDEKKRLFIGPQIYIPENQDDLQNVAMYGIVTDQGIESALSHAMRPNGKIDLLLLWTIHKLVLGAQGISKMGLDKQQQNAAKELFGSLNGLESQNSYVGAAVDDDDEFATMNRMSIV